MKLLHTTPLLLGSAAALALAPAAAARESCSATAQLAKRGIVTVTFTCSMHVNSTSVTLGPGLRLAGRPVFRATGQTRACTTSGTRHVACTSTRPTSVGAVDVNWRPIPAVGDPILFSATSPAGSVSLHLTVTTWDDND